MDRARIVGVVWLLSLCAASASAQLSATAVLTASRTEIAVGEPFRLQLEVDVTGGNAEVQPPDLSEFEVVGRDQRQSIEMGQQLSVTTVYSYTLRARRVGRFTIPAARVRLGSRTVQSNSLVVQVGAAGSLPPNPGSPPPEAVPVPDDVKPDPWADTGPAVEGLSGASYDGQAFLQTTVDRAEPYVGQQVTVTVYLYTRAPLSSAPAITQQPSADRFWTRDLLPQNRTLDAHVQRVGGTSFRVYLLLRFAAFPLEAGPLTIGAPEIDVRAGSLFDVFRTPETLHRVGVPVEVTARPLPEGGPARGGIVGSYQIESSLDRPQVGTGDAVTLTATLSGSGNLRDARLSLPPIDGLRVLSPLVEDDIRADRDRVGGTRRMEWLLVPERPGSYTIPPLGFEAFDPELGSWQRVEAPALHLLAAGNALSEVPGGSPDGEDAAPSPSAEEPVRFRPIHVHSELLRAQAPLSASAAFPFALSTPPLLFVLLGLGLLIARRRKEQLAEDPGRAALKLGKKLLDQGRQAAKAGDAKGAYDAASEALLTLLGARLGESARGLTLRQVERKLEELGADEDLTRRLVNELESCDFARFSAAGVEPQEMEQALKRAGALLVRLDRLTPQGVRS